MHSNVIIIVSTFVHMHSMFLVPSFFLQVTVREKELKSKCHDRFQLDAERMNNRSAFVDVDCYTDASKAFELGSN